MASADRRGEFGSLTRLIGLAIALAAFPPSGSAADDEAPGLDLLAYLGSWQGTDDEWLAVAEWEAEDEEKVEEPEPSEEKDDD